jgi:hypothetical protein
VNTRSLHPAGHKNPRAGATDRSLVPPAIYASLFPDLDIRLPNHVSVSPSCLSQKPSRNARRSPIPGAVDPGSRLFPALSSSIRMEIGLFIFAMRLLYGELSVCPAQMMTRYLRTRTGSIIGAMISLLGFLYIVGEFSRSKPGSLPASPS